MLRTCIFWPALIFSFVISSTAYAVENCAFSNESITELKYSENSAISVYQWIAESNEIKGVHWSCEHYGKHAVMVIGSKMATIPSELNEQVLFLGKIVLNETELILLSNAIKDKSLKLSEAPIKLAITSREFDEFYIQISIVGEAIFIEIKLYQS